MKNIPKILLAVVTWLLASRAQAQTYSLDWFTLDGGGGASTGVPGPWPQVSFPYLTNAPNVFIRVTAPSGHRFYRLRKP